MNRYSVWVYPTSSFTFSVNAGTTFLKSPTTPNRASLKMLASASLLMAMMFLAPEQPAMCWLDPDRATAMYRVGPTILPVSPTWIVGDTQPLSQGGLVAPVAAFR